MNGMIQIVGYMIAAYGAARLIQTSHLGSKAFEQAAGLLGVVALVILAALLTQQADAVASLSGL